MTNEFAIKVLTELRGYGDKFANIGFDRKEALDLAIEVLEQQPCEDCISREALLDKLEEPMNWTDSEAEIQEQRDYEGFIELVKSMPSITPSRPKGKWIHWTDDYKDYVTCSCCGYGEEGEVLLSDKTPFCPICGADMRGDTE